MPSIATLPSASKRVLIASNPWAGACGAADRVAYLRDALEHAGFTVGVGDDLDRLAAEARRLHADGELRALVAAGGDGTVAELVNRTEPGTPISILPLGTANLLARYLGIKRDPAALAATLAEGAYGRLDAGRAGNRIFLLMVGCGFDAEVVGRLHRRRSGPISYWSYAKPILASIRSYRYPELRVYCDSQTGSAGEERPIAARWVFVVNLPCYAGGLRVAPHADGTDALLDLCTFCRGRLWHGLKYVGHVLLGRHRQLADCTTRVVRRLRIESDHPVPYQLDGDPGGFLPLEIEILPERVTLVAPRAGWTRLGFQPALGAVMQR